MWKIRLNLFIYLKCALSILPLSRKYLFDIVWKKEKHTFIIKFTTQTWNKSFFPQVIIIFY